MIVAKFARMADIKMKEGDITMMKADNRRWEEKCSSKNWEPDNKSKENWAHLNSTNIKKSFRRPGMIFKQEGVSGELKIVPPVTNDWNFIHRYKSSLILL
jgi:hypothetical protein